MNNRAGKARDVNESGGSIKRCSAVPRLLHSLFFCPILMLLVGRRRYCYATYFGLRDLCCWRAHSNRIVQQARWGPDEDGWLNLHGQPIGLLEEAELIELAEALRVHSGGLKWLNLSNCRLNDDSLKILLSGLKNAKDLDFLSLDSNWLSTESCTELAAAAEWWPQLTKFQFLSNEKITEASLHQLQKILVNPFSRESKEQPVKKKGGRRRVVRVMSEEYIATSNNLKQGPLHEENNEHQLVVSQPQMADCNVAVFQHADRPPLELASIGPVLLNLSV